MTIKHFFKSALALTMIFALTLGLVSCTKSPQEQFIKAEEEALDNTLDALFEYYDTLQTSSELPNQTVITDVSVEIGTTLLTMLNSMTEMDLSWINDTNIGLEMTNNDDRAQLKGNLSLLDDIIISVDGIMDMATGNAYLAVPELAEKYISLNLAEAGIEIDAQMLGGQAEIFEKLPEKKVLRDLIEKYVGMLLTGLTDVTATESALEIGSASQECTALEVRVTEKAFAELVKTILTEMRNDAEFKEVFIRLADIYYSEIEGYEEDTEELYQYFIADIDVSLKDMEDAMTEGDITDETLFTLTTYLGKKDAIIGQKFVSPEGEIEFFFGIAEEDGASELQCYAIIEGENIFEIKGELTETKDMLSGEFEIFTEGTSLAFVDLKNVDTKKLQDGYFNGTVSIAPSEGFLALANEALSELGLPIGSFLAAFSLDFDVATTENTANITMSIMSGSEKYLSIETKTEQKAASEIELPSSGETETDINAWSSDIDLSAFITKLDEETELPDTVMGLLYMLITPDILD